ncbi:MAG: low molecular weight phosphotyrosine protein phosphatase [Saprospirales bacterium]|nr:MAG: low molecular weight phosphotyrosine protein phosphatase [Saprospirales bacterium]
MKILMVCLGNICRSPLAEGIMKEKVRENNLEWDVSSAGTSSYHIGESPDPRSVKMAESRGLDITDQRAMQFQRKHFEEYDLIYAMDRANLENIYNLATKESDREKVKMIMEESSTREPEDIPDPYWNNQFTKVYDMLDDACEQIVLKYSNHNKNQ